MSRCEDLIPLSDRQRWEQALSGIDHAFGHTWASCHAMHATTGHDTYLYQFRDGDTIFVCPIAERSYAGATDVVTPYGFSGFAGHGDASLLLEAWNRFARQRGYVAAYIALNPLLVGDRFGECPDLNHGPELFFLDLSLDEDRLLAGMDYRRRRPLNRWRKDGSNLLTDPTVLAPFFRSHYASFMQARGARATYRFSDETLARLTEGSHGFLLGQGTPERVEAAALFCHTRTIGEFMFVVSREGGRRHTDALVWAGAIELKRRKVRWLSLGGGIVSGDGVENVKRGYGGLALRMPILKQVFDPLRFRELCRSAGANPEDRAGFFPPYRKAKSDVH